MPISGLGKISYKEPGGGVRSRRKSTMTLTALLGVLLVVAGTPGDGASVAVPLGPVLPSGSSYVARVNVPCSYASTCSLNIGLCGAASCCGVSLSGTDDEALGGFTFTTPYVNQVGAELFNTTVVQKYDGPHAWPYNTAVDLVVQSNFGMFGVGVKGQLRKLWVRCPTDAKVLSARGGGGSKTKLLSPDKVAVPLGITVEVGQMLTVAVEATLAMEVDVWIGYCDDVSCAAVQIGAPTTLNDDLAFRAGLVSGSEPGSGFSYIYQDEYHSTRWENVRSLQLSVGLHPDGFLMVWKAGRPDRAAAVPMPPSITDLRQGTLKTSFDAGYLNAWTDGSTRLQHLPNPYVAVRDSWNRDVRNVNRPVPAS